MLKKFARRFTDHQRAHELHTQLGQLWPDSLVAELRDSVMTPEHVACARLFLCSLCLQRRRSHLLSPSSLKQPQHVNHTIATDCFHVPCQNNRSEKQDRDEPAFNVRSGCETGRRMHRGISQSYSRIMDTLGRSATSLEAGHVRTPHVEYSGRDIVQVIPNTNIPTCTHPKTQKTISEKVQYARQHSATACEEFVVRPQTCDAANLKIITGSVLTRAALLRHRSWRQR